MDDMARVVIGILILRDYVNHSHVEPSHDVMEVWVDRPINPDVVRFLEHIGWHRSEIPAQEDRFYFFT